MNPIWNMEEARQLIAELYGPQQMELARPSLSSVIERRDQANILWHSTRAVLSTLKRYAKTRPLFTMAWSSDNRERTRYWVNERKAQAYVTGLIQSLHSLSDLYAHGLYFGLALNKLPDALEKERNINASRVRDRLKAADLATLRSLYESLFEGGEFKHLAAISNSSKHRNVVKVGIHENYTGVGDAIYLEFPAFKYNDVEFTAVAVREFTEREFNRCAKLIVDIGNELNRVLQARKNLKSFKA
jgi:hypothetical protein